MTFTTAQKGKASHINRQKINDELQLEVACTKTLFYFSFRSFRKHWRTCESARTSTGFFPHHYSLALTVNKSPVVYILSPSLDGPLRENRGSVNRLTQKLKRFQNSIYPSRKSTLTFTSHLGQNCDLKEGQVVSYTETSIDPTICVCQRFEFSQS